MTKLVRVYLLIHEDGSQARVYYAMYTLTMSGHLASSKRPVLLRDGLPVALLWLLSVDKDISNRSLFFKDLS